LVIVKLGQLDDAHGQHGHQIAFTFYDGISRNGTSRIYPNNSDKFTF